MAKKQTADERAARQAAAKKGSRIILVEETGDVEITGYRGMGVVAGLNANLRTEADCRAWMDEHNFIGTLTPVRYAWHGPDGEPRSITRKTVEKTVFE